MALEVTEATPGPEGAAAVGKEVSAEPVPRAEPEDRVAKAGREVEGTARSKSFPRAAWEIRTSR